MKYCHSARAEKILWLVTCSCPPQHQTLSCVMRLVYHIEVIDSFSVTECCVCVCVCVISPMRFVRISELITPLDTTVYFKKYVVFNVSHISTLTAIFRLVVPFISSFYAFLYKA